MHEILSTAIEMALNGDRQMIKLLLDFHLSKPQASEDENQGKDKIQVNIKNLTLDKNTKFIRDVTPVIDALEDNLDPVDE